MNNTQIISNRTLFKFGEEIHMKNLIEKGQIYMNTMGFFRKLTSESPLADFYEGVTSIQYQDPNTQYDLYTLLGHIRMAPKSDIFAYPTKRVEGNIYSLHSITADRFSQNLIGNLGSFQVPDSFINCKCFVWIHNPKKFMEKVLIYLTALGYNPICKNMNYIDYTRSPKRLSQFTKDRKYASENKLRIYVENEFNTIIKFEMGDLSEICKFGYTSKNNQIRYEPFKK